MALEYQRYGRNKETLVNKTYLESGEYRRKFDNATNNPKLNKALYNAAKTALKHRSGTQLEDMYWFDGNTGKEIFSVINSTDEKSIVYTSEIKLTVSKEENVVTLHTHPGSMPPSIEDFNSCCSHKYECGFIACHNGKVFGYSSKQMIRPQIYEMAVIKYENRGFSEYESQFAAIIELKQNYMIDFWEVTANG